jgi:hypothetical protein
MSKHELLPVGGLLSGKWRCSCGEWTGDVPKVGAYGHKSMAACMSRLRLNHRYHIDSARRKAEVA